MNITAVRLLSQPAFQAVLAAAVVGVAAALMGRSVELKTARIPVEQDKSTDRKSLR
ncbi:MAG: hypothetical protein ABJF10_14275 [Chthoniobacter sp.]|uniref:hypothetical protein n=1 Tax=Chthoniobacter sp. TaxID=2510640 RepID=UPI0032A64F7C